mmetsp:Transcript_40752/g.62193  ORF Transcript_40752/g.62193 Transcript_40752/m.62193 type:complete len:94 (-) Transcript_40752:337-618(-)
MPLLIQREIAARALKIDETRHIFNETLGNWLDSSNLFFDPTVKYKEVFTLPRINYTTEVMRQLAMTHKRIVAIVDTEHIPFFEDAWLNLPAKM